MFEGQPLKLTATKLNKCIMHTFNPLGPNTVVAAEADVNAEASCPKYTCVNGFEVPTHGQSCPKQSTNTGDGSYDGPSAGSYDDGPSATQWVAAAVNHRRSTRDGALEPPTLLDDVELEPADLLDDASDPDLVSSLSTENTYDDGSKYVDGTYIKGSNVLTSTLFHAPGVDEKKVRTWAYSMMHQVMGVVMLQNEKKDWATWMQVEDSESNLKCPEVFNYLNDNPNASQWILNEWTVGFMVNSMKDVKSRCVGEVYNDYGHEQASLKCAYFLNGDGKTSAQKSIYFMGVLRALKSCAWRALAPMPYKNIRPSVLVDAGVGLQKAQDLYNYTFHQIAIGKLDVTHGPDQKLLKDVGQMIYYLATSNPDTIWQHQTVIYADRPVTMTTALYEAAWSMKQHEKMGYISVTGSTKGKLSYYMQQFFTQFMQVCPTLATHAARPLVYRISLVAQCSPCLVLPRRPSKWALLVSRTTSGAT